MNKFIVFCFASLLFLLSFSLSIPIVRCGDGGIWQEWWVIVFSVQDLNDGYGNTVDICGWVWGTALPWFLVIRSYGVLAVTIDGNTEVLKWKATAADISWGTGWAEASLILKILAAQPEYAEVCMLGVEGKPYLGTMEVVFRERAFVGVGMVQIEKDSGFALYNYLRFHRSQHFL